VTGDRLLDACGVVADHRQIALSRRQKDDATGMGHQNRRPRMLVVSVELLNHDYPWAKLLGYLNYTIVQSTNPLGQVRRLPRAADDACLTHAGPARSCLDNGVAGDVQPRVHTKDALTKIEVVLIHSIPSSLVHTLRPWPRVYHAT